MEPLTIVSSFATIVGLIGQFRSERKSQVTQDISEFIQWLKEHGFDELSHKVKSNTDLNSGINELLQVRTDDILSRLQRLDEMFASMAGRIEHFTALSAFLRPQASLSDQAVSILKQMDELQTSKILKSGVLDQSGPIIFSLDTQGQLEYSDSRFIEDDLKTLVEHGLLRLDYTNKGEEKFIFTRLADRFLKDIKR